MNLQGEALDRFLDDAAEEFQEDSDWLRARGWKETEETHEENGFSAKVWISPTGEKTVHATGLIGFSKMCEAIHIAHGDFLKELGWHEIKMHHWKPTYKKLREEPLYKEGDAWQHFVHPESGKLYMYLEAVDIARYYDNSEEKWLDAGNRPCGKTEMLQEDLAKTNLNLKTMEELHIKFVWLEEEDTHVWMLK